MKLLLTSDWHLDAVTAGIPRVGEFDDYLERVVEAARGVDAVAMLGDVFDPGRMNGPEMTVRLLRAAVELSGSGVRWVFWIAGNHDVVESSAGWTTLSPLAEALAHGFLSNGNTTHHVYQHPAADIFASFGILALPYQARAAMDTSLATALARAANIRDQEVPLIVLGHMTVPGAIVGSESHEMARGRDVDLPMDHLADLSPVVAANGHYHKAQTVKGPGGLRVVIPGSPHRFTFGEREDADKGFVVLEIPGVGFA